MSNDRSVRSSQLITPFGPGAIIDIGDESLLLTDLNDWPRNLPTIEMKRLTNELGVRMLKAPPTNPDFGKADGRHAIQTIRFPRWMFCPSCRKMGEWKNDGGDSENGKPICKKHSCNKRQLVPMRFVAACESGHLSDVAWIFWAHSGPGRKECGERDSRLYFRNDSSKGSGLDALFVECDECGSKRNLGDITSPGALDSLKLKCTGSQPWEKWDRDSCESSLVVLQRGASNLYYPIVRSALDIPNEEQVVNLDDLREQAKSHGYYCAINDLIDRGDIDNAQPLLSMMANDFNVEVEVIAELFSDEGDHPKQEKIEIPKAEELQLAEWRVLSSPQVTELESHNFVARIEPKVDSIKTWGLDKLLERVVLLDKLREVRAFCGFERVKPGIAVIPPAGRHENINWLPAMEVFGEGIFIQFDQKALMEWERKSGPFILTRIKNMQEKYEEGKVTYLPEPTPRLVAMHTFAHLLIRQLSFECGYSSGSIRERIYAETDQAGILIYTADSDSEGSLGGLVQQGEAKRLYPMIAAALEQAGWCSNDPVCSEMETQGVMGLNKAACHSCTLVSETSCTMNNLLLDRKLLLGNDVGDGFFTAVIENIKQEF
jgi:hypothetical protein